MYLYNQMHVSHIRGKHVALFNHRTKNKERQYNKEKASEVVRRKPGDNRPLFVSREPIVRFSLEA